MADMSTATIDTANVSGRRTLHFDTIDQILDDVDMLGKSREIRALGNWSPGQIFQHLANTMNCSIDGFKSMLPAPLRWLLRIFMKKRILTSGMTPGFKLGKRQAEQLVPPPTNVEDGLLSLRTALHRLKTEAKRSPSAFLGHLTDDEWTQIHCRHAELHLSFLVPTP
jgi:hypothetical protein